MAQMPEAEGQNEALQPVGLRRGVLLPFLPAERGWEAVLMADQQVNISYIKSPLWRVVSATGAAVGGIGSPASGMEVTIRFTLEWADILNESFLAEVNPAAGTTTMKGTPTFSMGSLSKIEEVAVKLPAEAAAGLVVALLSQFGTFSVQAKQNIRAAFAKLPPN
jgi:hypothetical protein